MIERDFKFGGKVIRHLDPEKPYRSDVQYCEDLCAHVQPTIWVLR
jgi:hypothetical protein